MTRESGRSERLVAEIPAALKYLVDDDSRTNKQLVIEALERELGVSAADSTAMLRRQRRRKEQKLREEKERYQEAQERVESLESDVHRIDHAIEEREHSKREYESRLDTLLESIEGGETPHVWETSQSITDLADEFEQSPDEVLYDLKRRAVEEDRDLYTTNFMRAPKAEERRRAGQEKPISEVFDDE